MHAKIPIAVKLEDLIAAVRACHGIPNPEKNIKALVEAVKAWCGCQKCSIQARDCPHRIKTTEALAPFIEEPKENE